MSLIARQTLSYFNNRVVSPNLTCWIFSAELKNCRHWVVNTISYPYHMYTEIISSCTAGLRNKFTVRHPSTAFLFVMFTSLWMKYEYWEICANHWFSNQRKMFVVLMTPESRERLLPDSSALLSRGTKHSSSLLSSRSESSPLQRAPNPYKEYFPLGCQSQFWYQLRYCL